MSLPLLILLCTAFAHASYRITNFETGDILAVNVASHPPEVVSCSEEEARKQAHFLTLFEIEKSKGGDAFVIKTSKDHLVLSESSALNVLQIAPVVALQQGTERDEALWHVNLGKGPEYITNKKTKHFLFNFRHMWGHGRVEAVPVKGAGITGGSQWVITYH